MSFTLKNLPCATGQRHCYLKYLEKMNSPQGYLSPSVPGDAIFLVYRIGTFFHDEKTGLYSAGVLSTFLYLFHPWENQYTRYASCFLRVSCHLGRISILCRRLARGKAGFISSMSAVALAFLTKGIDWGRLPLCHHDPMAFHFQEMA